MRRSIFSLVSVVFLAACSSNSPGGPSGSAGAGSGGTAASGSGGFAATGTGGFGAIGGSAGAAGSSAGAGGTATTNWGPEHCSAPAGNVGFNVGDSIGELVVTDCDTGAPATIDDLCGAKATWIFVAHSHCPTCKATAGFTKSVAEKVATKDVAIAHILYNDNGTSCATWREAYELAGITNVRVYEDPTGATWSKLKNSNYTAPSAILDANRVVTFKAHGMTESGVLSKIDQALAK